MFVHIFSSVLCAADLTEKAEWGKKMQSGELLCYGTIVCLFWMLMELVSLCFFPFYPFSFSVYPRS